MIPVIYELDQFGEATGTIHFFCSHACRENWDTLINSDCESTVTSTMHKSDAPEGVHCEGCQKEIT